MNDIDTFKSNTYTVKVQSAIDTIDADGGIPKVRELLKEVIVMMEKEMSLRLQRDKLVRIALVRKGLLAWQHDNEIERQQLAAQLEVNEKQAMLIVKNENLMDYQRLE